VRGGILSAWDPATQKERWFALGGGQSGGGTVSLASNLVIQTLGNGHLKAFTADKGEPLLDITLPLTSGVGPPMTYMLDGKQYIAVFAGTGAFGRGGGRGRSAEPTAAAVAASNNPKLLVYAIPN
jgi:quinohemoprotein ethanol dehydrogenase